MPFSPGSPSKRLAWQRSWVASGDQAVQRRSMSGGSSGTSRSVKPDPSGLTVAGRGGASGLKTNNARLVPPTAHPEPEYTKAGDLPTRAELRRAG
jgi:hypothetical protein